MWPGEGQVKAKARVKGGQVKAVESCHKATATQSKGWQRCKGVRGVAR